MTHQAKRPYAGSQPSITSYFSPSNSSNYSCSTNDARSPPLPPSVQSNLLSVGMRVRKSVPEGYKTGTYSAFQLFSDTSSTLPTVHHDHSTSMSGAQKPKTRPRAGARELTPFCGILKVGGMAQQQWGIYSSSSTSNYAVEEDMEDGDMPVLSQGSTVSDVSVVEIPNGHKRRFFEDEDEVLDFNMDRGMGARPLAERPLAVPRRKRWTGKVPDNVRVVGQENAFGVTREDVDFEDADFLDYGLVGEVEMSG
ncbi:uncharacterized protein PAC_08535 [Phialocephala subalpina]|uniref:Uncharacterized protein n=1 Tax=Phialocephala subalpina TaxID=576137 RepID=A0A1L7X0U4_9HELO|nr:uncharacterized protein PAC_08535 [Phialocephala subalpina]